MNDTEFAMKQCELDDYDIIWDVLGSHKQLVKLYGTALCECAEQNLRDLIKTQMIECAADQFEAFNYMNERGMYECECADEQKLCMAKEKFCQCEQEMNQ